MQKSKKRPKLFFLDDLARSLWAEICKQVRPRNARETMPQIRLWKGFSALEMVGDPKNFDPDDTEYHIMGLTWNHRGRVDIFLMNQRKFKLNTLVHELIHARGWINHRPAVGFYCEDERDKFSRRILKKLGLPPELKIGVWDIRKREVFVSVGKQRRWK